MNKESEDVEKPNAETFWAEFPGGELLHQVTDETWETFISHNSKSLVVVYDPACPNCQALRKPLIECAQQLQEEKIPAEIAVLEVDMMQNEVPNIWSADMGVPSIFWFVNGRNQVEYEGVRTAESMMTFVKEELKQQVVDWSTQDSAEDIHHLDDHGFEEFIQDQEEALVFFYSPVGCQICDGIKPNYEEAATLLDELKPEAAMVAVNIRKAPKLKLKYKVASTPMIFYFKRGRMKYKYHGELTAEALVDFMLKPAFIKNPKPQGDWFDEANKVIHLEEASLLNFVSDHEKVLVMFYAPWCGHCKKVKPAFVKAADLLDEKLPSGKLAAINGNNNKALNSQYNVTGFPTLVYFEKGLYTSHYKGKRTADAVVDFMINPEKEAPAKSKKAATDETDVIGAFRPTEVALLDPENFERHLDENENVLVMFYAPWCGACKKAKTPYFDAAVDISEDLEDSSMAIFNADKHRSFADNYGMKGYPTMWFFRLGKKMYKYRGEYTKDAFVDFMSNPHESEEPEEEEDKKTQWIMEKDDVKHLSRENFDKTLNKHKNAMVFFYMNACQYCLTTIKPRYVEAAKILAKENSKAILAAINGDWEKPIVSKYNVNSFPTFLFFRSGKMQYRYEGPNDAASIVEFMKSPSKKLAEKKKPKSWQDLPEAKHGRVEHLSNKTYDSFLEKHNVAMVMFHSLWYPRCLPLRQEFRFASEQLPSEIGMGAVDCHRMPEQGIICYKLSVKAFPIFKFYRNGIYQKDFEGAIADDFILFLSTEASRIRDEL